MVGARIAILQSLIADYRVPFYRALHERLSVRQIDISVFASVPRAGSYFRDGLGQLPFGHTLSARNIWGNAYWQGGALRLREFDLVILPQEVRALTNYLLIASRCLTRQPAAIALWGHGRNFQRRDEISLTDRLRQLLNARADHFFAYTELSKEAFIARGATPGRITVVNNSKDTSHIVAARMAMSPARREAILREAGLDPGSPVAVFCSRLHEGKRLPFLVDAVRLVRKDLPNLQLLIIGDGPMSGWLDNAVRDAAWVRRVGARYGSEQADLLVASDLFLMPAHLGLSVLDAFAAGLPVVVAAFDNHSPEICYLENNVNGYMCPAVPEDYATKIRHALENPAALRNMKDAAIASAEKYSLSNMVESFASGIERALSS